MTKKERATRGALKEKNNNDPRFINPDIISQQDPYENEKKKKKVRGGQLRRK